MIEIIEGKGVGAGKSFYVTTRILSHIANGGTVFASDTFELHEESAFKLVEDRWGVIPQAGQWNTFKRADIWRLHEVTPPGSEDMPLLVIVDECHGALNARDWNDKNKRPFFDWLTQSRHDDTDVIFISQHRHNIDTQVRRLVTYVTRTKNLKGSPLLGFGKMPGWLSAFFVVNTYDADGTTHIFGPKFHGHDSAVFKCYRSKAMRGSHSRLTSAAVPRRSLSKTTNRNKKMGKFILVAVIALGIFAALNLPKSGLFGKKEIAAVTLAAAPVPALPALRVTAPVIPSPDARPLPPVGAWDIIVEKYRSQIGNEFIRTDQGVYQLGRMSRHGFVQGLQDQVVRIMQASGRVLFLVCEDETQQGKQIGLAAPVSASPPALVSIPSPGPVYEPPAPIAKLQTRTKSQDVVWRARQGIFEDGSAVHGW